MDLYDIVKRPVIRTEKVEQLRRELNQYTFEVDKRANKLQIREAIEKLFNVKVETVNTLNIKPKNKRYKLTTYKTPAIKKAIVTLKEGEVIEAFEN